MKVLIIPQYSNHSGGTYSFLKNLLKIHDQNQIESIILLEKKQPLIALQDIPLNKKKLVEIETISVPSRPKIFSFVYLSLLFDVYFILRVYFTCQPDIMHVSNATPGLMLGAFLFPCPIIFTMHSYPVSRIFTSWLSFYLIGLRFYLSKVVSPQKYFVTVSCISAQKINQYMGVSSRYIKVIPNGISIPKITAELNLNIVLTVGHVAWYKNPELWLEVAKKVIEQRESTRFFWVGDGDLLESMRDKASELKLTQNIFFEGSHQEVEEYYLQSSIYLQPSLVESQGIAVLEAMSYGLPCLVSDVGGLPESVIHQETGYICESHDIDEFVIRIIFLLDHPEKRKAMGCEGMKRVEQCFTHEIQEQKILDLYHHVSKKS